MKDALALAHRNKGTTFEDQWRLERELVTILSTMEINKYLAAQFRVPCTSGMRGSSKCENYSKTYRRD